jgi:hypothetical protein
MEIRQIPYSHHVNKEFVYVKMEAYIHIWRGCLNESGRT